MTERYYNYKGEKSAPITHDYIDKHGVRVKDHVRSFKSGEPVPPCKTCELILPFLICPEDKPKCSCS